MDKPYQPTPTLSLLLFKASQICIFGSFPCYSLKNALISGAKHFPTNTPNQNANKYAITQLSLIQYVNTISAKSFDKHC